MATKPLTATLSLYVNHRRATTETRVLALPRFLHEVQRTHEAFMARMGITEPTRITIQRGDLSRKRLVAIGSGPLNSVVSFDA